MSWLSKSLKKAAKGIGKAHQPFLRGALNVATGGLSGKAESVLKSFGVGKRGRPLKSEQGEMVKVAAMPTPGFPQRAPAAPIGLVERVQVRRPISRVIEQPSKRPATARSSAGKGNRMPPKGGLDLKAIAAKWRKAGKPGRWIDFVKANR